MLARLLIILLFALSACSGNQGAKNTASNNTRLAVENSTSHCVQPEILPMEQLKAIAELPDPFVSAQGKPLKRKVDWNCRRAQVASQIQAYELGEKPAAIAPQKVEVNSERIRLTLEHDGRQIDFEAVIHLPTNGQAPYPAVIGLGRSFLNNESLSQLGVAVIDFPNNDLAEQLNTQSRGKGKFFQLFGEDHSASAMMAWAWGISRLVDALEIAGADLINVQRLGVTGCSRNGKGALVAGAFDERIALTLVQESGSGGVASWRISDDQRERGQNVQTLRQIVTENVWFREDFGRFAEDAVRLPYDHHQLMGMVAPRALLVVDNGGFEWLSNESSYAASLAAREIWKALGVEDRMGISQQTGHNHCVLPEEQTEEVANFVRRFLLDDHSVDTQIVRTDVNYSLNWARWVPWKTPQLK
jgi:hypothetical protein